MTNGTPNHDKLFRDVVTGRIKTDIKEFEEEDRKRLFDFLKANEFNITNTDLVSMRDSRVSFRKLPPANGGRDKKFKFEIAVLCGGETIFTFVVDDGAKSILKVLSESSFIIKTILKLKDDPIDGKKYFITLTVMKDRVDDVDNNHQKYLFSFTAASCNEENSCGVTKKIFISHSGSGTGGSGRN